MKPKYAALLVALTVTVTAALLYAQQTAEVTGTIPARFVQVYTERQQAQGYSISLFRDTKTGSGNVCVMVIQSLSLGGLSAVDVLQQACQ
jgi:hypothetical protein